MPEATVHVYVDGVCVGDLPRDRDLAGAVGIGRTGYGANRPGCREGDDARAVRVGAGRGGRVAATGARARAAAATTAAVAGTVARAGTGAGVRTGAVVRAAGVVVAG